MKVIFEKYFELATSFKKEDDINKNATKFCKKDRFDILLDKNIKEYLKREKDISNESIITLIMEIDPIYNIKSNKNISKRDYKILDYINFQKIDKDFIELYRKYNFEKIFQKDIVRYLTNLFNKVENWENFVSIYDLINVDNLQKK